MTETIRSRPLYDTAPSYARRMATKLLDEGTSAAPVEHWTQGAARLAQSVVGGMYADQASQADTADRTTRLADRAGDRAYAEQKNQEQAAADMKAKQDWFNYQRDAAPTQADTLDMDYKRAQIEKLKAAAAPTEADTLDNDYKRAQIEKLKAQAVGPGGQTYGERALDRNFAKTYESDIASGAMADSLTNMQVLRGIADQLEKGTSGNVTGPVLGLAPESFRAFTNPQSVDMQNQVANIVQRSLRPILGAQFTEKEGENLIKRAYNPQLEEAENAKRIRRLAVMTEKIAKAKMEAAAYFETNGTLKGYKGTTQFNMSDLDNALGDASLDASGAAPPQTGQQPGFSIKRLD